MSAAKRKAKTTTPTKRTGKTKARKQAHKVAKKTIKKAKVTPRPLMYKAEEEWFGSDCAGAGKRMEGRYIDEATPPRRGRGLSAS
ncbi:MAG: hypothetical protein WCN98_06430 [Verrucomicrobiaceae bacterium]